MSIQAWLLLPIVACALRGFGLRRTLATMQLLGGRRRRPGRDGDAAATAAAVALAVRYSPVPYGCLPRSVLLHWLLGRRGVAAALRIGARRGPGGLEAHAWVECDGVAINDVARVAEDFHPFPPLPGSTAEAQQLGARARR